VGTAVQVVIIAVEVLSNNALNNSNDDTVVMWWPQTFNVSSACSNTSGSSLCHRLPNKT